jgi:hypothetical protein
MISSQSKSNLEAIFASVGASKLAMAPTDEVVVSAIQPRVDQYSDVAYMITVASFKFKLLIIFRVPISQGAENYYRKASCELGFHDVFPEICNLCGGAVNRELARQFEHLGLSTPNEVEAECFEHLAVLRPSTLSRHTVTINQIVSFDVFLAMVAYAPVEIVFPAPENHVAGELELL